MKENNREKLFENEPNDRIENKIEKKNKKKSNNNGIKNKNSIFSAEYTVFDSLYDGRKNSEEIQKEAKRRFLSQEKEKNVLSFHPDTGVNTCYPVEKNKKDFFNRMYETRIQFEKNAKNLSQKIFDREMGRGRGSAEGEKEEIILSEQDMELLSKR